MKLDGKIKIGSRTYKVNCNRSYDKAQTSDFSGIVNYRELEIWINTDRAKEYQVNSMYHELIHAIFEEAAIRQPKECEVERLANVLKQLIEDNPAYFGKGGKLQG